MFAGSQKMVASLSPELAIAGHRRSSKEWLVIFQCSFSSRRCVQTPEVHEAVLEPSLKD